MAGARRFRFDSRSQHWFPLAAMRQAPSRPPKPLQPAHSHLRRVCIRDRVRVYRKFATASTRRACPMGLVRKDLPAQGAMFELPDAVTILTNGSGDARDPSRRRIGLANLRFWPGQPFVQTQRWLCFVIFGSVPRRGTHVCADHDSCWPETGDRRLAQRPSFRRRRMGRYLTYT